MLEGKEGNVVRNLSNETWDGKVILGSLVWPVC